MSESHRTRLRVRPRNVVRWVAIVVVLALIAVIVYAVYNYEHFVGGVTHIDAIPAATSTTSSSGENVLLVGDDHRPANASPAELAELGTTADGGGTNTDSMLILHMPAGGGKATLVSLPRDSWVDIPGHGMGKLNAAFAYGSEKGGDAGGAQLLVTTVQKLTTLHIDHFVRISMIGFYDVAKALGPLKVCLVSAVNDHYSTFVAPAGVSTLSAQQALAFVRQRHGLPLGDIDREARQRYFLSAEAKNFLKPSTLLNPSALNQALTALSGAIQTDKGLNWLSLAAQLKSIAGGNLTSETIPLAGTPTIAYGGSYVSIVQVDTAKMPAFIAALDAPQASASAGSAASAKPAAAPPSASSITVTVLNGSGTAGAAATNSTTLAGAGFKTTTPSTVSTRAATTIQYPPSLASSAAVVASHVPGATLESVSGVANVTLVLGTDGKSAKSSASAAGSGGAASASSGSGSASSGSKPSTAATTAASAGIPCIN